MTSRLLGSIAVACAIAIAASSLAWIRTNPLPSYWDEAMYANEAIVDHDAGFIAAYNSDTQRPPAHRLLALPFTKLFGARLSVMRVVSIAGFIAAAAVLAFATGEATTFLIVIASPVLVLATKMFGTEPPLLLAIALMLLALTHRRAHWSLLGIAIGLGCLAKSSFFVVAVPMIAAALIIDRERRAFIVKGTLLGAAIAATWWIPNGASALRFGVGSGGFSRHSLGSPWSLVTLARWSFEFARCVSGWLVLAAIAIVVATTRVSDARVKRILILCISGAVLIPVATYTSANHNPRLVATTMFLLAAIAGTLATIAKPAIRAIVVILAVAQIVVIAMPREWSASDERRSYIWRSATEVMAPIEQWDWTPLRAASDRAGIRNPLIAIIGEGYQMNPPSIVYAWTRARRNARVMLVAKDARDADIIVTAPGFRGDPRDGQPQLNAYNEAVVSSLSHDSRVAGPFWIDVGVRRPMRIAAFFNRQSVARAAPLRTGMDQRLHRGEQIEARNDDGVARIDDRLSAALQN